MPYSRTAPEMRFEHLCNITQGIQPGMRGSVTKHRALSSNVTITSVNSGRFVHTNSDGEWEMGADNGAVPHMLIRGLNDSDVGRYLDSPNGAVQVGDERLAAIPCIGGYEVQTDAYDAELDYNYDDPLHAVASNTVEATAGVLTNSSIVLGENNVVGFVSEVPFSNANKVSVITLYLYFQYGTAD